MESHEVKLGRLTLVALALLMFSLPIHAQVYRWIKKVSTSGLGNPLQFNPLDTNIIYGPGMFGDQGGINISRDRGKTWQAYSTITGGFEVKSLIINPKDTLIMVAAQRGTSRDRVMKTTDGGASWSQTLSGTLSYFGVALEFNPAHPDTVFTMVGDTIWRSTDFGSIWTNVSRQTQFNTWCDAALRPDSVDVMYVGDNTSGIWKTTDGGVTFHQVYATMGEIPMIAIDQQHPSIAFATKWSGGGGLLKTTDYGESWNEIPQFAHLDCWGVSIAVNDPSTIVMGTYTISDQGGIYISRDGGTTWSRVRDGLFDPFNYGLLAIDSSTILALQGNGVYDFESSKTFILGHVLEEGTSIPVTNGMIVKVGSLDTIYLGQTGGQYSFAYFAGDATSALTRAYPFYPDSTTLRFVVDTTTVQDIFLERLPTGSFSGVVEDSLTNIGVRADLHIRTVTVNGLQTVSATTDSAGRFHFDSLYISAPPVVDGYQVDVDPDLPYSQLFHSPIHVDTGSLVVRYAINRADVFVVGEDSANYSEYYKDALISMGLRTSIWNIIVKGVAPFQRGREFKKNTVIYFSGTKHTPMRQSELDNLVSCLDVGCNLFLTGQDIVEKNDSSTLIKNYLSVHYGGVGTTPYTKGLPGDLFDGFGFYTIGEGASNQTSRDIIATADPRVKAIMGYGGTGANGTAGVRLDSVGSGGKAVVLGFGFEAINTSETRLDVMHQIIAYFDGSIILDVNDGSRASQPVRFKLDQNYPNPFNPLTSFSYWIAEKGHVTLRLFNILGEEVVKLVDDERLPGIYSVQWNAERCPTGVYLAQISVASPQGYKLFQASRKLLLMK